MAVYINPVKIHALELKAELAKDVDPPTRPYEAAIVAEVVLFPTLKAVNPYLGMFLAIDLKNSLRSS